MVKSSKYATGDINVLRDVSSTRVILSCVYARVRCTMFALAYAVKVKNTFANNIYEINNNIIANGEGRDGGGRTIDVGGDGGVSRRSGTVEDRTTTRLP